MYFAALAVMVGFLGAGYWLRQRGKELGAWLLAAGGLGCVALIVWQFYHNFLGDREPPPDRYHAAAAYVLGYQAVQSLAGQSGTVGIILPKESGSNIGTLDAVYNTVARILTPFPRLEMKELNLSSSYRMSADREVSLSDFERAVESLPGAIAYFSFVGFPKDYQPKPNNGSTKAAIFFVFDPAGGKNWQQGLQEGWIQRVVAPREASATPKPADLVGPPDQIFQQHFVLLTAGAPSRTQPD